MARKHDLWNSEWITLPAVKEPGYRCKGRVRHTLLMDCNIYCVDCETYGGALRQVS